MSSPGDATTHDEDRDGEPAIRRAAVRRAAGEARRVLTALVASGAPAADLDAAAATLAELADRLEPHAPPSRYDVADPIDADGRSTDTPFRAFDTHPIVGPANAVAPPVLIGPTGADGTVVATAVYGTAYEGPAGCVHGGMLAAGFDYVLAAATMAAGIPTLTGSLTVRFRRGTPLHREVRYEGRVERVDGRQIHVTAHAIVDGEVTAESEGIFVSVDPNRFRPDPVPAPSG